MHPTLPLMLMLMIGPCLAAEPAPSPPDLLDGRPKRILVWANSHGHPMRVVQRKVERHLGGGSGWTVSGGSAWGMPSGIGDEEAALAAWGNGNWVKKSIAAKARLPADELAVVIALCGVNGSTGTVGGDPDPADRVAAGVRSVELARRRLLEAGFADVICVAYHYHLPPSHTIDGKPLVEDWRKREEDLTRLVAEVYAECNRRAGRHVCWDLRAATIPLHPSYLATDLYHPDRKEGAEILGHLWFEHVVRHSRPGTGVPAWSQDEMQEAVRTARERRSGVDGP